MAIINKAIKNKLQDNTPPDLMNVHACLYEIDMVQDMARHTDGAVHHYTIADYADLLDKVLDPLKELLGYGV